MNNLQYYLAVDGGGSNTQVICADQTGRILGEGLSGPTSLTATSVGAASFNLREGVRQATESLREDIKFHRLVMGLAGMDTPKEHRRAKKVFTDVLANFPIDEFILVNDTLIALEAGTDAADALVLISGTGSNCYGRTADGREAKAGGMDFLLTDQGSGYAIGRRVLREAVKSYDGRGKKTVLESLVCQHFGIESVSQLKDRVYKPNLKKSEVAALSKVCMTAYNQNDEVAHNIFHRAADDLTSMIRAVVKRLQLENKPLVCVLEGSITRLEHVNKVLRDRVAELYPQATVLNPKKTPVYGALKLAVNRKKKENISSRIDLS